MRNKFRGGVKNSIWVTFKILIRIPNGNIKWKVGFQIRNLEDICVGIEIWRLLENRWYLNIWQ